METESLGFQTKDISTSGPSSVVASIPVTVQVMLGTTTMQLAELMALKPDSELLLDQPIGEPVTVIVNGTKIARGELYVLETRGDLLGVRITEVLKKADP